MSYLTVGVVAHVDAGKTSLTERLLYDTGVLRTLGSVDSGTTRTDSMALERHRGITIRASVAGFGVRDLTVTLVDTPGHPDFLAEVERSIGVLDAAVLVVSAVEGVQSQTVMIWRALQRAGLPTVLFLNKIDRRGADSAAALAQLRDHLGVDPVPLTEVQGEGTPAASARAVSLASEVVVSAVAAVDDRILAAWSHDRMPGRRLTEQALGRAIGTRRLTAVLHGSALTGAGVRELLDVLPLLPAASGDPTADLAATVFAVDRDESGLRRTWVRMWQGAIEARTTVALQGRRRQLVTGLSVSTAAGLRPTERIRAGEVGAVFGLADARVGDTAGAGAPRPAATFPPATLRTVVEPIDPADRGRAFRALQELADEDPLIDVELSELDDQPTVRLRGEVQQEVIAAVLAERFGVEVRFATASAVCIERIAGPASAVEILGANGNPYLAGLGLRIVPAPDDSGVAFNAGSEPGRLPPALVKAAEEGVLVGLSRGRCGWAVTDCVVTLTASEYFPRQSHAHQKFNKAMSTVANDFRHLAPVVVRAALDRAGTRVCEPWESFELEVPEGALAAVLNALGGAGSHLRHSDPVGRRVRLAGTLRSAEVHRVSRMLPDLTSGHGIFTTTFDRYVPVRGPAQPTRRHPGADPGDRQAWFRAYPR